MRRTTTAALATGWLLLLPAWAAADQPTATPTSSATVAPAAAVTATPTPTPSPGSGVTAAWHSYYCGPDYGWFVTNSSDVPHTLTLTLNGQTSTITLQPGETHHVGNANRGDGIKLVDEDGTVLIDGVGYDCTLRTTVDVSVQSGSAWTVWAISAGAMAPAAKHGTVTFASSGSAVRYVPDACFVGSDVFGYRDPIQPVEATVHVTVLGPARGCAASPVSGSGSGGTGATLPLTGPPVGAVACAGAAALLTGVALTLLGHRSRSSAGAPAGQTFSSGA
jgi:hypothetical protein